jgi:hypothetical protein
MPAKTIGLAITCEDEALMARVLESMKEILSKAGKHEMRVVEADKWGQSGGWVQDLQTGWHQSGGWYLDVGGGGNGGGGGDGTDRILKVEHPSKALDEVTRDVYRALAAAQRKKG